MSWVLLRSVACIFGLAAFALLWALQTWRGRPDVLGPYPFTSPKPISLYFGKAPSQRIAFQLDFKSSAPFHTFRQLQAESVDTEAILQDFPVEYVTGQSDLQFVASDYDTLSVHALAKFFRSVGVCDGYVFIGNNVDICNKRDNALLKAQCSNGVEQCVFRANFTSPAPLEDRPITFSLSMSNKKHVLPAALLSNQTALTFKNASIFPAGSFSVPTIGAIASPDDTFIFAVQLLASSLIVDGDTGTVQVWQSLSDDVNSEAISYTVLLMLVFGFFVYVSRPISNGPINKAGGVYNDATVKFLLSNTSFSLFVGSLLSVVDLSAYSHQYTPVETDILLGEYGPQSSLFLPACMLVLNAVVALVVNTELHLLTNQRGIVRAVTLRCLFESQIIFNIILTVPPSAGQAFRISIGFFFGTLLSLILGRDSCRIFSNPGQYVRKGVFLVAGLFVYVLIVVDLVAPMIWSARMATAQNSLFMAHLWVANVGVAGTAFYVFKSAV